MNESHDREECVAGEFHERAGDDYCCYDCGGRPYYAYSLDGVTLYECQFCGSVAAWHDIHWHREASL